MQTLQVDIPFFRPIVINENFGIKGLTDMLEYQNGVCFYTYTFMWHPSIYCCVDVTSVPSVHWHCWLGGRKGIRPVKKTEWWGAGVVIFLERGADFHMAQLIPLPLIVSRFYKIQIGFTFLVPAQLGSPGQWAIKRLCVCHVAP